VTEVIPPYGVAKARPIKEFSKVQNNYFEMLEQLLQQLYLRSGGTIDIGSDNLEEVSANENQIAHLYGITSGLLDSIQDLEADTVGALVPKEFRAVTKSSSYTAIDHDFVNAKQGATITLDSTPPENAIIILRNGDGSKIKMIGGGKTINGSSAGTIYRKGTALTLQYFIDSDEWVAR
jgi:hypothetical protein